LSHLPATWLIRHCHQYHLRTRDHITRALVTQSALHGCWFRNELSTSCRLFWRTSPVDVAPPSTIVAARHQLPATVPMSRRQSKSSVPIGVNEPVLGSVREESPLRVTGPTSIDAGQSLSKGIEMGDAPRYLGPLTRVDDLPAGRLSLRSTLRKIGVGFPAFRGISYVQPLGYE